MISICRTHASNVKHWRDPGDGAALVRRRDSRGQQAVPQVPSIILTPSLPPGEHRPPPKFHGTRDILMRVLPSPEGARVVQRRFALGLAKTGLDPQDCTTVIEWLPLHEHLADAAAVGALLDDHWLSPQVLGHITREVGRNAEDVRRLVEIAE